MSNEQLSKLQALFPNPEFAGPLSPATELDIVVFIDDEGWAIYRSFGVGMRVVSQNGLLWNVVGFTKANTVLCFPEGFRHDPMVHSVEFTADGIRKADW